MLNRLTEKFNVDVGANRINKFDEQWYQIRVGDELKDFRSVTTTLDVFPKGIGYKLYLQKYGEDADKIRNEAGQLGSHVHKLIELTLRGADVTFENPDGSRNCTIEEWERYLSWCLWFKDAGIEPQYIEQIVYDEDEGDAGTVDLIGRKADGSVGIADWKTGSFVGDAEIQVSRYAKMIERMGLADGPEWIYIVHLYPGLNKKGFRVREVKNPDYWNGLYLHTAELWKHLNKKARPKYKTYPNSINLEFIKTKTIIEE